MARVLWRRLGTQVGLDHERVRLHLGGRSLRNLLPEIEHDDPAGDVHHDAHVVLDEDHRRPPLVVDVEDEARHVLLLLVIAPAHRLVEKEHLGVEREGPPQLHTLLEAVRQRADRPLPDGLDLQEVDDVLDHLAVGDLLPPSGAPVEHGSEHAVRHVEVAAEHQVVDDGHAPEQRDVLERARDPARGDLRRTQARDVLALQVDVPALRMEHAADAVEQGRLAGAVGADDREDLALLDVEAHPRDGLDAADPLRGVAHLDLPPHPSTPAPPPPPTPPPPSGAREAGPRTAPPTATAYRVGTTS